MFNNRWKRIDEHKNKWRKVEAIKNTPLYDVIKKSVMNGYLPDDFSLPKDKEEGRINFADGALDGILLYHMGVCPLDEEGYSQLDILMRGVSKGEVDTADKALMEFTQKHHIITVIDAIQSYIIEHQRELSIEHLYQYSIRQLLEGTEPEGIKFGMSILEMINVGDEIREVIRTLGLCNEFTIFTVFCMMRWENGNDEVFELAQKVKGWGRIHAVERLEARNEVIKEWLLKEGSRNRIMAQYSSLTCFEKAEVAQRLKSSMEKEEFEAALKLMEELTVEQPMVGLSALENVTEVLWDLVREANCQELEDEDYEHLLSLMNYIQENIEEHEELVVAYQKIIGDKGEK